MNVVALLPQGPCAIMPGRCAGYSWSSSRSSFSLPVATTRRQRESPANNSPTATRASCVRSARAWSHPVPRSVRKTRDARSSRRRNSILDRARRSWAPTITPRRRSVGPWMAAAATRLVGATTCPSAHWRTVARSASSVLRQTPWIGVRVWVPTIFVRKYTLRIANRLEFCAFFRSITSPLGCKSGCQKNKQFQSWHPLSVQNYIDLVGTLNGQNSANPERFRNSPVRPRV